MKSRRLLQPMQMIIFCLLLYTTNSLMSFVVPRDCLPTTDLEECYHPAILETKRIRIPGFPHAFNGSLVRWEDKFLLCFRHLPDTTYPFKYNSRLGLVWLDDQLNPIGKPQLLETRSRGTIVPARAEDGRLIVCNGRLYLVYSDNRDKILSAGGFRVYVGELKLVGDEFVLNNIVCFKDFPNASSSRREKSWVPFDWNGQLRLAYSLDPHIVLEPDFDIPKCDYAAISYAALSWVWGELRGGTPAVRVGESYLAFFHSTILMKSLHSRGKEALHYFMGAYLFSKDPPFSIQAISPKPIVGPNFYHGESYIPYWRPVQCVFPAGISLEGNEILVSYGREDHEIWIVRIDLSQLLASLLPIVE